MKRTSRFMTVLLMAMVLCLSGCGSSNEGTTTGGTEASVQTQDGFGAETKAQMGAQSETASSEADPDALYLNDGTIAGHYQTYEIAGMALAEYAELLGMSPRDAAQLIEVELGEDGTARFAAEGEWTDVLYRSARDVVVLEADGVSVSGILLDGLLTLDMDGVEVVLARLTDRAFEEDAYTVDSGGDQDWHGLYTKYVGDTEPMEEEFELLLCADGTGTHFRDGLEINVVWERNGSDITMQEDIKGMTIDYVGTISSDELHLFNGDPEDEWTCEYVYGLGGGVAEKNSSSAEFEASDGSDTSASAGTVTTAPSGVSSGDGYVSEEKLLKTYVWINDVVTNKFDLTYEDIVAYFGVDGQFQKEEYSDHMKRNYRYYTWFSEENELDYIYFNFEEGDDGSYTLSAYNTNHFSGEDAIAKYLDEVKAESTEADKTAAANMEMKTITRKLYAFGDRENPVTVEMEMPASGWSYNESYDWLVDNEEGSTFGTGFIQFKAERDLAEFDRYKDSFENYQEIDEREIGGITFQGRTYKNIGYEWEEYIAELPDGHGFSIGIVKLDASEGSVADKILDSIRFK